MKKKFLGVLAALLVAGTASSFAATGIGLQTGAALGQTSGWGGAAVTFKLEKVPCVFAVNVPSFDPLAVGVTADWWIGNPKISGTWGWYYGVGLAGAVFISDSATYFGFGGRALIGTNVFFFDRFLEFYIQGAWQPMFYITNGFQHDLVRFPIDAGFRVWF